MVHTPFILAISNAQWSSFRGNYDLWDTQGRGKNVHLVLWRNREAKRANCNVKENWLLTNYSFLTLIVVYFHPQTGHVEYKCFILNFILWCFWYHVLSSQSSNTISSTGIMNKEWIEAWTERENGTWGEWLCGQWNESYAFFSISL